MKHFLTTFCMLLSIFACKSAHFTPKNFKGDQLSIGSSGGVTGMMKEYVLLKNGKLFLSNGITGDWKEVKILKKSTTREIFTKAEELGISTLKFKHPGNMTYYLILKQPERSNEIKWGESGIAPPEGIPAFYDYLISLF